MRTRCPFGRPSRVQRGVRAMKSENKRSSGLQARPNSLDVTKALSQQVKNVEALITSLTTRLERVEARLYDLELDAEPNAEVGDDRGYRTDVRSVRAAVRELLPAQSSVLVVSK